MAGHARPWLDHYPEGVPTEVEIPDEPHGVALERAARRWPDRAALDFFGASLSYAELDREVDRAAGALFARGVRLGDRVAIVAPNCSSHAVAFHALQRLGAVVVECNPTYSATELAHQLEDAGVRLAIVWDKALPAALEAKESLDGSELELVALDMTRDLPRRLRLALRLPLAKARSMREAMSGPVPRDIARWHELLRGAPSLPADAPRPRPEDVALIQYTGGTTGTPKGAVLTHRNLVANGVQGQAWARFTEGAETVFGALPFFHAFGLTFCLTLAVQIGATAVAFPRFDAEAVVKAHERRPATFVPGVAPMFDRIVAAAEKAGVSLRGIRLAFAGAMPIPAETARRWEEATGGLLIEGYGLTESSPVALGNPCDEHRRPGALGLPFPSTDVRVVDTEHPDELRDAEPDEEGFVRGELLIKGPQVFQGYWNRPEETAHQLVDGGWLRTGDVVRMGPDGVSELVDRIKEMIVTGGFKIYPSQVEDHLRDMPGVLDVAVVGLPGSGGDERVAAAVVLEEEGSHPLVDLASVRAWGEKRLARYALPRAFAVVKELPRSQLGKVLRRSVREDLLGREDVEQHRSGTAE